MTAKKAALAIPSARACERLIRYETAIDRQLHRAISQLEFLQAARGKVGARSGGRQGRGIGPTEPTTAEVLPARPKARPQLPE